MPISINSQLIKKPLFGVDSNLVFSYNLVLKLMFKVKIIINTWTTI